MYITYACIDASSQQLEEFKATTTQLDTIQKNKTDTIYTVFKEKKKMLDTSIIIKLQRGNDSIIRQLEKNTKKLQFQNLKIDSMLKERIK